MRSARILLVASACLALAACAQWGPSDRGYGSYDAYANQYGTYGAGSGALICPDTGARLSSGSDASTPRASSSPSYSTQTVAPRASQPARGMSRGTQYGGGRFGTTPRSRTGGMAPTRSIRSGRR